MISVFLPLIRTNNPKFHGNNGYLKVDRPHVYDDNGLAILKSWKEIGLKEIDYSIGTAIGTAMAQFTSVYGVRQSTNKAFIRPIRNKRPNLTIKTNARVSKILFDRQQKKAIGVEYISGLTKHSVKRIYARREVIVSSGVMGSPKLLMLSGIGPVKDLKDLNIDTIVDVPVGKNLQDHLLSIPVTFDVKKCFSALPDAKKLENDLIQWLKNCTGKLSEYGGLGVTTFHQTSFEKRPGVADIQFFFTGMFKEKSNKTTSFYFYPNAYYNTINVYTHLLAPKSRGYVKLNKANPLDNPPEIVMNYLSDPEDLKVLTEGVQYLRKIIDTKALKHEGIVEEVAPKVGCKDYTYGSDDYAECCIKKYSASSFHAVGTCKMGPVNDQTAVVDSKLKVHGVKGLRVIDASIFPTISRGNPMATVIMIAEKGSDMIKSHWLNKN